VTVRDLEKAIWKEAKAFFCNPKLRLKDILEWSSAELKPECKSEVTAKLPDIGCWVCIPCRCDLRKPIGGTK